MTAVQQIIVFAVVVLGTVMTRFLPYVLFPEGKEIPKFVEYLGKVLAPAVFGLLVVYCLRNVRLTSGSHGIPELISMVVVIVLFLWKRGMVVPMAGGTICYMILVQTIFA